MGKSRSRNDRVVELLECGDSSPLFAKQVAAQKSPSRAQRQRRLMRMPFLLFGNAFEFRYFCQYESEVVVAARSR
jgi:hypothetical protein